MAVPFTAAIVALTTIAIIAPPASRTERANSAKSPAEYSGGAPPLLPLRYSGGGLGRGSLCDYAKSAAPSPSSYPTPPKPSTMIQYTTHAPARRRRNLLLLPRHPAQGAKLLPHRKTAGGVADIRMSVGRHGCGWCRPMLRKIHRQECKVEEPWWRKISDEGEYHSTERDAQAEQLNHENYAQGRQQYLKETGRKPQTPLLMKPQVTAVRSDQRQRWLV